MQNALTILLYAQEFSKKSRQNGLFNFPSLWIKLA